MSKTIAWAEGTFTNVTEPFTVMLTNEAQQFATDSNRKVTSAQSYYTDIIVIRGSQERTDYTIGNITSGSGITVSKSSKRVTFSVSADTTIGADTGVIEIPITLDGQTVKKQFSWSCGKQGPQGVQGNDGNSFAWNMLSETNCGKKHWGTESSGGKYSVEDFITEDNIDAVKLICTEAISTSNWSYVSFKDIKMLKQLKPSTKYTLSYDIKANRSGAISHSICKGDVSNFCTNTVVVNNIIGNETWQHISVVLTTNDLKTTPTNEILYLGRNALSKVGYSIIKNLKLVEGDIDTPWSPSQSDIEGKGVVETVQYYLATSQASGVTSSTSGWSTDITTQKLTADKKYLWNCYQTKYSDGTSEPISTPKVIGVYGDKGQNAKNLSITPSSQYFKSTDGGKTFAPNTITIKPTIQGEISFGKWQYSIDGGISFADVVSEQKGLTVSNNVLTVSKDSSLYSDAVTMVTFRAVASDSSFYDTCSIAKIYDVNDIGDGRNLLWNSNFAKTDEAITGTTNSWGLLYRNSNLIPTIDTSVKHNGFNTLKAVTTVDGDKNSGNDLEWYAKGISEKTSNNLHTLATNYTLSFYAKASVSTDFVVRWGYDAYDTDTTRTLTTDWQKYEIKLHQTTSTYSISIIFKLLTAGTVWFSEFKLEKGSSATGYSPAPEDVQTAILSTKSEIADVSLKVDKNKQAIEQRVEKTTYQQDLNLVKGDISKANEGLNKWRYEIYPKSLFASEYQGKSTMDVFAKNTNLTPSQSVLINDTDFGKSWAYGDNYIGYALTFVKFSAAKSVAITFKHDDGAHLYLNGKLIGGDDTCNTSSGESLTLSFIQGWNCLEVVLNEKSGGEYIGLGTTISTISECQLMNCYYGTPVARQSHITNQLVQNTTDIDGVSGSVQKVMSTVGGSGKIDEFVSNYATWKKKVDGIETRVGETYTTKDDFDDLQIGGRNLLKHSSMIGEKLICDNYFICNNCNIQEYTNDGFHIITPTEGNANNGIAFAFDNFTIMEINGGDTITFSCDIKGTSDSHAPFVSIHISDNNWYGSGVVQKNTDVSITKDWQRVSVTITTPTGLTKNHMWLAIHGNHQSDLYVRNFKLEKGNKPTDWTPAPEDVNGKIVNVETIANQTAKQFEWIVKGGDKPSSMVLTDDFLNIVANNINLTGKVTFNSFDQSLKDTINNKTNVSYLSLSSGGNNQACWKIATIKISGNYINQDIIIGVNHRDHGYTECRIQFKNAGNPDPGLASFRQTGRPSKCWQIIKTANSTWELYLYKTESWDGGNVVKYINPYHTTGLISVTWSGENADLPSGTTATEQMIADQTTIDGGIITTGYLSADRIAGGSITADKIATDAIKSRNYISSGGTQGSFLNLSDGSFTSPNLSWDSNGNLIAKNANLSGEITATKGSIGKYKIDGQWLITGSGSTATGIGGNQAFWAGAEDSNSAPFRVGYNGKLYANGATISGDITATTGKIGDLTLKDGILTGTGSYSEPYTEDDDGTVTSTITTNYITKLFGKGLTIDSTVKYSDEDDVYSYKVSVLPDEISFTDGEEIGMLGAGGLQILQVNDNSDSYSSEANEVSLSSGASNFYYTTPVNQTTDKYLHVCFSADGASFMASQGDKFNSFDIGYSSAKYSGNFAANKFVYTGNSLNYVECLEANDTTNVYFHSSGYYSFRVNNEGNWSNETQSVYITERGISVPGKIGLYSQEMSNYVARYYVAGSTKSTAIGNNSYQTRIYGSSVWANKAVSTSDVRLKQDFQSLDKFEDLYMQLQPVSFKYIDGYDKSEDRYFGLKAQPTEKLFEDMGENPDDYAMFNKFGIDHEDIKERIGYDVDFDEEHGLDYTNLITLNTHMVQKTRRELAELQKENAELKDMLKTIVKKINM